MSRSLALGLCGLSALALAGCHQDASLQVTWSFLDLGTGDSQSAAVGCGQHGVDSIFVTAVDTTADSDQVLAICALGQVTRSIPAGTWTLQVQGVDVDNALMPSVVPAPPISDMLGVGEGGAIDLPLTLTTPPACSDGIDNDGDGRVDLADPDCAGDPGGTHE